MYMCECITLTLSGNYMIIRSVRVCLSWHATIYHSQCGFKAGKIAAGKCKEIRMFVRLCKNENSIAVVTSVNWWYEKLTFGSMRIVK